MLKIDTCKTANKVHYCYCHRGLCNGENAESIIEKLGDVDDDAELVGDESKNSDSEEASGSDDEDFDRPRMIENDDSADQLAHNETTTLANEIFQSPVTTTAQSNSSKAVSFNLRVTLMMIFTTFVIFCYGN